MNTPTPTRDLQMKLLTFCPLFNQKDLKSIFNQMSLPKCHEGLFRPLEMVALPGSVLEIYETSEQLACLRYPLHQVGSFFTFENFLKDSSVEFKKPSKLDQARVIDNLSSYLKAPYVWGGNWILDNPQEYLATLGFSSGHIIDNLGYLFSGLDCSGLLYAATYGSTPRNTSQLVSWGEALDIEGLSDGEILEKVMPLDLLVWKGHVLIFLDQKTLIESRLGYGVVTSVAEKRLAEIRVHRQPAREATSDTFVIRRWAYKLS
jgi:hypothetical protein